MDTQIISRCLLKQTYYVQHGGKNFMIYGLYDVINNKFAVAMANNLYSDEKIKIDYINQIFDDLIQDELNESFLPWFFSIKEALDNHFADFLED